MHAEPVHDQTLQQRYAESLAGLVIDMAQQQTNILLQLFADNKTILCNKNYPDGPLFLSDGRLQSYYHTHVDNILHEHEHGHFHIFKTPSSQTDDKAMHLVALSMDAYGQPSSWFTVNQWVTSRACYDGQVFLNSIEQTSTDNNDNLIQQWLMRMLQFYRRRIMQLLDSSKQRLKKMADERLKTESLIYDDRSIYFVDEVKIDLVSDLAEYFH